MKITLTLDLESPEELARVAEAINFAAPNVEGALSAAERAAGSPVTAIGDAPKRRGRPPKAPQETVVTAPAGATPSPTVVVTAPPATTTAGAPAAPTAPATAVSAPAPVATAADALFDDPAPAAPAKALTRDDVKAALLAAMARLDAKGVDGKAAAFGLLQKNGAASLQALAEDKYAVIVAEAAAL